MGQLKAALPPLEPGRPFDDRVLRDQVGVFRAEGLALKGPELPPLQAPAQGNPAFSRLEITGSRVVCERVDIHGGASGRFTLDR
jgi:hypothetical protein